MKGCRNAIPIRNEGISTCNFSINLLKTHLILKIVEKDFIRQQIDVKIQYFHVNNLKIKNPGRNKCAFHQIKNHQI